MQDLSLNAFDNTMSPDREEGSQAGSVERGRTNCDGLRGPLQEQGYRNVHP